MAFDPGLAVLMLDDLGDTTRVVEKRMFGGLAFMAGGHMVAGVVGDHGFYRPGPVARATALGLPGVTPWVMGGRTMGGYVLAAADAMASDTTRAALLALSLAHIATLAPR